VLTGSSREFFAAAAGTAGALTGLLFVAISVVPRQARMVLPPVVVQIRAAAAMLAFSNALAVSLFSLVPDTNAGYPSAVLGIVGVLFTAAAVRSILSSHAARRDQVRQLELMTLLLAIFGTELVAGIVAIARPHSATAVEIIGYAIVASVLVGVARAWELVSERDTGVLTSIAVLAGHAPAQEVSSAPDAPSGPVAGGTGHDSPTKAQEPGN
jgi:hypothetical protein